MANIWHVLFLALIGGVFSLIGGLILLSRRTTAEKLALIATPFAAGTLLGAAFFDLLPEALEVGPQQAAFGWAAAGLLAFFVLERFLHWFHHHHEHPDQTFERPTATLIISGDTIHNAIDGVAIGAAFLVSVPTGIITTLAVAAHEIPQEIGDFGLLLKLGFKKSKVLLINIFSSLATVPLALATFALGGGEGFPLSALLAITAGFFIYIAASDLIPRIHASAQRKFIQLETVLLIAGVLLVWWLTAATHDLLGLLSWAYVG